MQSFLVGGVRMTAMVTMVIQSPHCHSDLDHMVAEPGRHCMAPLTQPRQLVNYTSLSRENVTFST